MNIFAVLTVSSMLADLISSETTKEPSTTKSGQQAPSTLAKDFVQMLPDGSSRRVNSLWVVRPETQESQQPNELVKRVAMKPAHSLTRLAKTLTLGFDPTFNKGYFEPFERRPKPVTLVAFRKNGLLPSSRTKLTDSKSAEIAELQSPFNDVGSFWTDD